MLLLIHWITMVFHIVGLDWLALIVSLYCNVTKSAIDPIGFPPAWQSGEEPDDFWLTPYKNIKHLLSFLQYSQTKNNHLVPLDDYNSSIHLSTVILLCIILAMQYTKIPCMAVTKHYKVYLTPAANPPRFINGSCMLIDILYTMVWWSRLV